jgi:hypothetical protein
MAEEYTFLLNKSYSRESRADFPGNREWKNRRDPGKSGTRNPGNETLIPSPDDTLIILFASVNPAVCLADSQKHALLPLH